MKKFFSWGVLVPLLSALLFSCKKDEPAASLPAGMTDAEYIDGVLGDALEMINVADFNPVFDMLSKAILPNLSGSLADLEEGLPEGSAEDGDEISISRFAGHYIWTKEGRDFVPNEPGAEEKITLSFIAGSSEQADIEITWEKDAEMLRVESLSDEKRTLLLPKHLNIRVLYKNATLFDGAITARDIDSLTLDGSGHPADMKATLVVDGTLCGYNVKSAGASLSSASGLIALAAPFALTAPKGKVAEGTLKYTQTGRTEDGTPVSAYSMTVNVLDRLSCEMRVSDILQYWQAVGNAAALNTYFSADLYYSAKIASHDKRNASLVYVSVENQQGTGAAISPAFRTKKFKPEDPGFISQDNFPRTYSRVMEIVYWAIIKLQTLGSLR